MSENLCKNIIAFTPPGTRPPYLSINYYSDLGTYGLHVRGEMSGNVDDRPYYQPSATINIPPHELESIAWALARHFGISKE